MRGNNTDLTLHVMRKHFLDQVDESCAVYVILSVTHSKWCYLYYTKQINELKCLDF